VLTDLQNGEFRKSPSTSIIRVYRRLESHRSSILVGANDGGRWSITLPPTHTPDAALREAVSCELGAQLGLPTVNWRPQMVDTALSAVEGADLVGQALAVPVVCFAISLPVGSKPLYEYLPTRWIKGSEAAAAIVGMQVLDAWLDTASPRAYVAKRSRTAFEIRFLGSPYAGCGVPAGGTRPLSMRNPYLTAQLLEVSPHHVRGMVQRILALQRETLESVLNAMPQEWRGEGAASRMLALLLDRRLWLSEMNADWLRDVRRSYLILNTDQNSPVAARGTA
jgi:hypothetical protein